MKPLAWLFVAVLAAVALCTVAAANMAQFKPVTAAAGIKVDSGGSTCPNTTSTASYTHTIGAITKPFLYVMTMVIDSASIHTTGVTYNGVALTQLDAIDGFVTGTGHNYNYAHWYLKAPATGAHTLTATAASAAGTFCVESGSWDGVNQTSPIDAHGVTQNQCGLTCTSVSPSITVVASNATVLGTAMAGANFSGVSGNFINYFAGGNVVLGDSNVAGTPGGGTVAPGAFTATFSTAIGTDFPGAGLVSIVP